MIKALENRFNRIEYFTSNRALLWMTLGGFTFAAMGALVHGLGEYCDWLLIVLFRMAFTFIATLAFTVNTGTQPFVINRPLLWFRSAVGCIAMLATFYALTKAPISDVAVVTETRPIWVALLAGFFLGESTDRKIWMSIIIGLIGIILIEHPYIKKGDFAILSAFLAAFTGAIVMICLRKLRALDPRSIVIHFSGTATIVSLLIIIFYRQDPNLSVLLNPTIVLMLIGIGLFGTIGQLAMTKAFSIGQAPSVASAGYSKIGFSAAFDFAIWRNSIELSTISGMILILTSVTWLFKKRKRNSGRELNNSF